MKSRKFHIIWITARNTAMNDSDVNSLVIRGQKLDSADIFSIAKDVYEQHLYKKQKARLDIDLSPLYLD